MPQPLIHISRKQALIFASFLVFYEFLTYIANDMIMPGMIKVVETFHGSESAIATSLSVYILGGASLQLFLGPLSDRYGRRPIMIFGASLFFICTVLIALSNSMEQFLISRFLQGMGLCFIGVVGYATLQEIFAEMDAIRLIAVMANVSITAPLIGPLLGAVFIQYFVWRNIFYLISLFALIALWGLWQFMPESVGEKQRDGQLIPRTSLSPRVIWSNYKQLLLSPPFIISSVLLGLAGLPCVTWIALAPVIIVSEAKWSFIHYGLLQIPIFAACMGGNWFLRFLTHHWEVKKIIILGSSIVVSSLVGIWFFSNCVSHDFLWFIPALLFYFFGYGVVAAPLTRFILFFTSVSKGTASALMSLISMTTEALGIEIANLLGVGHHVPIFGLFSVFIGLIYLLLILSLFYLVKHKVSSSSPERT